MWQPYRPPSSRKKPNVPPTRQTQARKNRRVDTIVISDDESDSAPAPHDSPSPAGIHAPPLLTDGILLKDKSSRQNPSSCERSSSSVGREKAKGQVESSTPVPHFINSAAERKRKESLDTIIVAKPNLSTKRRRIDLHHKPSPSRDNAQQDHTQGTEKTSGGAQLPTENTAAANNVRSNAVHEEELVNGSMCAQTLRPVPDSSADAQCSRDLSDLRSSHDELKLTVALQANNIDMVQEQISNKASLKAMEEVEQKAQEMHSTLENQVNEKPSMEQVRSAIEESNGPLREELQKGQEMRSALENQVNEKPSMEQVRSAIKESNETHREELQKGQEIHSALENQVNEKPSMEQVRSAIQESNGSLREELQKGQEMHSALENQVNEKPSMEQVRSAIQESNGPLREELQKSSNSININFDKLSNDLQRKHTETANSVNSLDITVSTIAKNVHNIETSILPTALEPFRNDIDAVVTAVRCVDKLDSKHKETEKSVNALESKMSAVTTNIEAIEKSVVPNALDPIQKDITALKATTESLSNIGTEQSAVQQTVQRLESDISRLQAQTSPESIEATVHEAILTSRRPAQTQDTSLPLPNRKHFEDMAHRLTDVICANREIRTTVDMHVKESEEEKEKHQNQLLEQVNLIRSMQQDMEKFKERMYKKEAEMARLQEAAVQRDREVLKASEDIYQSLEAIEERLNSAPTPPSSDTTIATSLEALENRVLRDYDSANHYFYKYRKLSEKFEHRLAELERERQSTPCENGTNSGMANLTVYIDSKLEEYDRTLQSYVPREVVNTLVSRVTLLEHETERLKNKQLDQGCKDNHESQHTKAMDDLDAALHADIENLKADFKAAMDSMSQSLVSRIDTKTTEAFDSTNDCIHQVVDALRGELGPTSEDFLKTLQHGMEEKKPEWLEAVTGLISETFDPNNNETRFKFGPLFKKLFEEEYADCNRRLQALENGAKRADETTPCRVADTEPYDYLAPEDYNELRKFSGKTRFDVDNVRSEVGTVVVSLRNLRRNAEKKVAESKKDIARFQENMTMENNRSVEGLSVFKQSITQNLDVIVLAQQQYQHRISNIEKNMQNHAGMIDRFGDILRRGYVVRETAVLTPSNPPRLSRIPPSNTTNDTGVLTPQNSNRAVCQMPPSPTSPALVHAQQASQFPKPTAGTSTPFQHARGNSSVNVSQLQQYPHSMQYNQTPFVPGLSTPSPGQQQPQLFHHVNRGGTEDQRVHIQQ